MRLGDSVKYQSKSTMACENEDRRFWGSIENQFNKKQKTKTKQKNKKQKTEVSIAS